MHLTNVLAVSFGVLVAALAYARDAGANDQGTIAIHGLGKGRVIAVVHSSEVPYCLNPPISLNSGDVTDGFLAIYTNVACLPISTDPYEGSVELGYLPDGQYTLVWWWISGHGAIGGLGPRAFAVAQGEVVTGGMVSVVEYYYPPYDHYFITSDPAEIAALDSKAPPFQDWQRTGEQFNALASATAPNGAIGVCRFYNDHFSGTSSHFYAAQGLGCEDTVNAFPDWTRETANAFSTYLPSADGTCPAGVPIYRLYNDGHGGAPNHRYTKDLGLRQSMLDAGWVPEGYGIGVAFCAPS